MLRGLAFIANPTDLHGLYMRQATGDGYAMDLGVLDGAGSGQLDLDYMDIDHVISSSSSAEQLVATREGLTHRLVEANRLDDAESVARASGAAHPLDTGASSPLAVRAQQTLAWVLSQRQSGRREAVEVIRNVADALRVVVSKVVMDDRRSSSWLSGIACSRSRSDSS